MMRRLRVEQKSMRWYVVTALPPGPSNEIQSLQARDPGCDRPLTLAYETYERYTSGSMGVPCTRTSK
jgi:hypothetical protein